MATLTHTDAFMADIIARPEDDTPRLIYADWLADPDESGEACDPLRAEFIRVQIDLARLDEWAKTQLVVLPESREGQITEQLRRRERELWAHNSREWFVDESLGMSASLGDHKGPIGSLLGVVRRGFVDSVTCTLADWWGTAEQLDYTTLRGPGGFFRGTHTPGHGPALVRAAPLTRVTLSDWEPSRFIDGRGPNTVWLWVPQRREHPNKLANAANVEGGHPSRDIALKAMSYRLLRWARTQIVVH